MIDINILIAVIGVFLAVATFYIGQKSGAKNDGKAAGALETDLKYIKESVGRFEGQRNREVQRLEGRIDEISKQMAGVSSASTKALESSKSAHNRLDEYLEREHSIKAERRPSD